MVCHSQLGSPVTPALRNPPKDAALHLLCLAAEGNNQHTIINPQHRPHHHQPHYPIYIPHPPPPPSHYHQSPYLYHPLHYTTTPPPPPHHPIFHSPLSYQQQQPPQQLPPQTPPPPPPPPQQHQHQQQQQQLPIHASQPHHHHLPYSPLLPTPPSPVLPLQLPPSSQLSPIQHHPVHKVKGPWRPEEDSILTQLVSKLGPRRWTVIASHIPGRTGKQARERWLNQLSPHLAKRPWTPEEDRIVMDAHARLGNRWSEIAKLLNGRTDNATKNRFNTTIRRQISELSTHAREELVAGVNQVDNAVATSMVTTASKSTTPPTSPNTSDAEHERKLGVKRKREATSRPVMQPLSQRPKTVTASS